MINVREPKITVQNPASVDLLFKPIHEHTPVVKNMNNTIMRGIVYLSTVNIPFSTYAYTQNSENPTINTVHILATKLTRPLGRHIRKLLLFLLNWFAYFRLNKN